MRGVVVFSVAGHQRQQRIGRSWYQLFENIDDRISSLRCVRLQRSDSWQVRAVKDVIDSPGKVIFFEQSPAVGSDALVCDLSVRVASFCQPTVELSLYLLR